MLSELQPITAVKQVEGNNWPGSASFTLKSPKPCFPDENHLPLSKRIAPIDLMTSFPDDPIAQRPNVSGYRFRYDKAIAQTLSEYEDIVTSSVNELKANGVSVPDVLEVVFKDGSDSLGDLEAKKAQGLELNGNHAMRYCYTLLEIYFTENGQKYLVYREPTPNSQFVAHTIMCACANEGDPIASAVCILPIEKEKCALHGNTMSVGKYTYKLNIWTTMYDEKLERHYSGLAIAASNYGCTLCYYNKSTDKHLAGSQPITRSFEDTEAKALFREENDTKLSKKQMELECKGVRAKPQVTCTSVLDATHADINVSGTFLGKLFIREIAEIYEWNETPANRAALKEAENTLYTSLRHHIGTVKKSANNYKYLSSSSLPQTTQSVSSNFHASWIANGMLNC